MTAIDSGLEIRGHRLASAKMLGGSQRPFRKGRSWELPRPDVPPGPQRDLVAALHGLHHRAGWPSLRTLAREAGCSHTTVSNVFTTPRLPSWGVLELLVEAMDGDTTEFHQLWLACGDQTTATRSAPDRIAGRRDELAVVRRHLEFGTGLLLVTGEAGTPLSRAPGCTSTPSTPSTGTDSPASSR